MSHQAVYDRVLALVCNVFDSYSAVLFLPGEGEDFRLAASFSLGDQIARGARLAPGYGLAGWIAREGKPLLVSNFDQRRGVLGYYTRGAEAEIRAFLGVPLPGGGGVLCVDSKKTYGFTEKDQKILAEFAGLVAALHQERGDLQESRAELRVSPCLRRLSLLPREHPRWRPYLAELLALCVEASGFECCLLAVRDDPARTYGLEGVSQPFTLPGHGKAPHFPLAGGMIGWVFKHNSPVLAEDGPTSAVRLFGAQADWPVFASVICQPVHYARRTRAVLVLASQESRPVHESVKDFARTVADQLALFLENLHLKARLSRPKT